jgi:AcrR family transcriptional regulator
MDAVATDGLREAKKRRTRATIASVAMELFTARGFDEVTVAEIARAAGVSEKTVFNYFPAKEDLVLERGQERRLALLEAVRDRPAGASLVEPFREQTLPCSTMSSTTRPSRSWPSRGLSWAAAPCAIGCSSAGSARPTSWCRPSHGTPASRTTTSSRRWSLAR